MLFPSLSRRSFLRSAAAASAATALPMILSEPQLAHAQRRMMSKNLPADATRIDANENPLGPCSGACSSISSLIPEGGRYDVDLTVKLIKTFADQEGLKPEYVMAYAGSSEPLHYSVLAFTSPDKPYITGDPGYEAGMYAAKLSGAKIIKVPLTATYAHDVKAMVAADPHAGVIYICSPNNPTGTLTPHEDIEYALEHKPKGALLLVDEAYIHFSEGTPVIDLVKADKDIIVLRTFSKLYGMAGVRCGFAVGRPDLLAKLGFYGQNAMSIMAVAAANASLADPNIIPQRKKINAAIRDQTFEFLHANNYSFIPSQSNCFMVDTRRPGKEVQAAMAAKNVYVGRVWPILPTYVRVTVGTHADMQKFQAAFKDVMSASTTAFANMPFGPAGARHNMLS